MIKGPLTEGSMRQQEKGFANGIKPRRPPPAPKPSRQCYSPWVANNAVIQECKEAWALFRDKPDFSHKNDEEIFDVLCRLNDIRGITTRWSCGGHPSEYGNCPELYIVVVAEDDRAVQEMISLTSKVVQSFDKKVGSEWATQFTLGFSNLLRGDEFDELYPVLTWRLRADNEYVLNILRLAISEVLKEEHRNEND